MPRPAWCLLLTCLLRFSGALQDALQLNDNTFERATQSSTGQTTGHWFVLFICPALHRVGDVRQVRDSWKALAEESWQESQGFQVAEVNTCHNHHLVERFNITDTTIIMFRDSMMYKYPNLSDNGVDSKGALQQFASTGFLQTQALTVPPPRGFAAAFLSRIFSMGVLPIGILAIGFFGIMFVLLMLLNERRINAVYNQQKQK